jgi:hypothetical protein
MDNQAIEIIEDLPLRADDAWYVLLVYLGLKSGAWIHVTSEVWREGMPKKRIPDESLKGVEETLKILGLFYKLEFRDTDAGMWQSEGGRKRYNQICDIYVTKDESILEQLVEARHNDDDKQLGLALGYPRSAVEAFGINEKVSLLDLDPKIRLSEVGQMTYFMLSKDWQNELKVVEGWVGALKTHSSIIWGRFDIVQDDMIQLVLKAYGNKGEN